LLIGSALQATKEFGGQLKGAPSTAVQVAKKISMVSLSIAQMGQQAIGTTSGLNGPAGATQETIGKPPAVAQA